MSQILAFHLAEDIPPTEVSGHYDTEQQLWIGQNEPTATYGTNTGTTTNTNTFTQVGHFGDHDGDSDGDGDHDIYN